MAGEHLVQRVRSALAQGDQAGAIALLRGADLPAIRQAIGELRALPAEEQRAIKTLLGQAARQAPQKVQRPISSVGVLPGAPSVGSRAAVGQAV